MMTASDVRITIEWWISRVIALLNYRPSITIKKTVECVNNKK